MRCLSIAGAIAIVLGAATARADGVGVIAVGGTEADRTALTTALTGALDADPARPPRIVADAVGEARAALLAGAVPVSTLERFRRVREQIDEGWRAFNRVQVDFAASRLAAARTEAESIVALPGGATLYADASLRLGAVLGHLGRTDESHAAISLALALDPDRPITLAEFSPDVVAMVDAVRTQTHPTRAVTLTTEPAGATLSIDGKDVGVSPLTLDLAMGQHVVAARLPLYETHALAVAVDASASAIAIELRRDAAWSRLAEGAHVGVADAAAQELTDAALRYADVDDVIVAAAVERRGGPTLLVQRCAGLPARCTAVVEVGYADRSGIAAAAREAWQTLRTADLRYAPSVLADARATNGPRDTDGRCGWCRSPIVWGGVGAAVVLGTIAVIAITSSSRPPPFVGIDPTQF